MQVPRGVLGRQPRRTLVEEAPDVTAHQQLHFHMKRFSALAATLAEPDRRRGSFTTFSGLEDVFEPKNRPHEPKERGRT